MLGLELFMLLRCHKLCRFSDEAFGLATRWHFVATMVLCCGHRVRQRSPTDWSRLT